MRWFLLRRSRFQSRTREGDPIEILVKRLFDFVSAARILPSLLGHRDCPQALESEVIKILPPSPFSSLGRPLLAGYGQATAEITFRSATVQFEASSRGINKANGPGLIGL